MVVLILSILSLIATISGLYLLGEKKETGFLLFVLSLFCQGYVFFKEENWILVLQMVVLIVFNIWTYNKWRKDSNESNRD